MENLARSGVESSSALEFNAWSSDASEQSVSPARSPAIEVDAEAFEVRTLSRAQYSDAATVEVTKESWRTYTSSLWVALSRAKSFAMNF